MQQKWKTAALILQLLAFYTLSQGQSTIQFELLFNNQPWQMDSTYQNSAGEIVQINRFMFYTSQWKVIDAKNDTIELSKEHYLMNVQEEPSLQIPFRIPANTRKILFNIGVDSLRNTTGIQTGVLDPARGMFWTWRTGYIMAKLHGISPQANTAGNRFSYEVGGFESPYNTVRTIVLEIPTDQPNNKQITIETHLDKWFSGKELIKISATPNCHHAGKLAMQLANNYATMFAIRNN